MTPVGPKYPSGVAALNGTGLAMGFTGATRTSLCNPASANYQARAVRGSGTRKKHTSRHAVSLAERVHAAGFCREVRHLHTKGGKVCRESCLCPCGALHEHVSSFHSRGRVAAGCEPSRRARQRHHIRRCTLIITLSLIMTSISTLILLPVRPLTLARTQVSKDSW